MKIIYPGTFDPITYGHIDLVKRAVKTFSEVIVAVVKNPSKASLFDFNERFSLAKDALKGLNKVKVRGFDGLVVDFACKQKIRLILRGLRMISDFEYEFQMALTNRKLNSQIETVFFMPHPDFSYISSRLIKEAFFLGADVSGFIPPMVIDALKLKKKLL